MVGGVQEGGGGGQGGGGGGGAQGGVGGSPGGMGPGGNNKRRTHADNIPDSEKPFSCEREFFFCFFFTLYFIQFIILQGFYSSIFL